MNDFVARKIGEVMAFTRVGQEIFDKAPELSTVLDAELIADAKSKLKSQYNGLREAAGDKKDVSETKADATSDKLRRLADTYVGEEWDNPVEVMEWLGFFEGAAVVHCALVKGAAETLENTDLASLAEEAGTLHHDFLHTVREALHRVGAERAKK
jgi:hypothetical protein